MTILFSFVTDRPGKSIWGYGTRLPDYERGNLYNNVFIYFMLKGLLICSKEIGFPPSESTFDCRSPYAGAGLSRPKHCRSMHLTLPVVHGKVFINLPALSSDQRYMSLLLVQLTFK